LQNKVFLSRNRVTTN